MATRIPNSEFRAKLATILQMARLEEEKKARGMIKTLSHTICGSVKIYSDWQGNLENRTKLLVILREPKFEFDCTNNFYKIDISHGSHWSNEAFYFSINVPRQNFRHEPKRTKVLQADHFQLLTPTGVNYYLEFP